MKALIASVAGLGVLGILCLIFVPMILSVYGLYLAFSASIILGVLAILIEPSPFVLGLLAVFGHAEVAHKIAVWLGL
jgi:hypothetical protein